MLRPREMKILPKSYKNRRESHIRTRTYLKQALGIATCQTRVKTLHICFILQCSLLKRPRNTFLFKFIL